MARSIVHGGVLYAIPGAMSNLQIGTDAPINAVSGVVVLIGEAESGFPGEITTITDAAVAGDRFGSGALANAIGPLFNPSDDDAVNAGANTALCIQVNQSSAAHLQLGGPEPVEGQKVNGKITIDSDMFESLDVEFSQADVGGTLEILSLASASNASAISRHQIVTVIDTGAGAGKAAILKDFGDKVKADQASGVVYRIHKPQLDYQAQKYGVPGNRVSVSHKEGSVATAYAVGAAFSGSKEQSGDVGGSPVMNVEYVGNLVYSKLAESTGVGSSDTTRVDLDLGGSFPAGHLVGKFVEVDLTGGKNIRKIKSHGIPTSDHVLTPYDAFTDTTLGETVKVIEGKLFTGDVQAGSDASLLIVASSFDLGDNDLAGLVVKITEGPGAGERRKVASNNANSITLATAFSTSLTDASKYEIHYITDAKVSVYGQGGKATKMLAFAKVNGNNESDIVSINFTEETTLQAIADAFAATGKYNVSFARGIPTSWLGWYFDCGPASNNFGVNISQDASDGSSTKLYMDAKAVSDWYMANSSLVDVWRSTEFAGTGTIYDGLVVTSAAAGEIDVAAGWIQVGSRVQYMPAMSKSGLDAEDSEVYLAIDTSAATPVLSIETNDINLLADANKIFIKLADIVVSGAGDITVAMNPFLSNILPNFAAPVSRIGGFVPAVSTTSYFLGTQTLVGSPVLSPTFPKADTHSASTVTNLVDLSANFSPNLAGKVLEINPAGAVQRRRIVSNTSISITFKPAISAKPTSATVYRIVNKSIRGISTDQDWQDALDASLKVRANHVVTLIAHDLSADGNGSSAAVLTVNAKVKENVFLADSSERSERNAYISLSGTKDQLLDHAADMNDRNIVLGGIQKPTVLDVNGNPKQFPEWMMAVIMAGMRSGGETGLPLTKKYINISGLEQDFSWDPTDRSDATEMIGPQVGTGGLMFAKPVRGRFQIVRDWTTYSSTENITYSQDSANTSLNLVKYENRTALEEAFVGKKAIPGDSNRLLNTVQVATVSGMKSLLDVRMEDYLDDGVVARYDPKTTRVQIIGNRGIVKYKLMMVHGMDFIPITEILELPQ